MFNTFVVHRFSRGKRQAARLAAESESECSVVCGVLGACESGTNRAAQTKPFPNEAPVALKSCQVYTKSISAAKFVSRSVPDRTSGTGSMHTSTVFDGTGLARSRALMMWPVKPYPPHVNRNRFGSVLSSKSMNPCVG